MTHRHACGGALLCAAVLSVNAAAQQPAQNQPVFRSGVQVVEVDARVFGTDGRFVADLTRDDFEILEDGAPQQIQNLYLIGTATDSANSGVAPAGSAPSSSAAVGVSPAPSRQTWIFLFDLNHLTPGGGFDRARTAVETFIRDRFKDGDLGGIVAGEKMVNNRFTSVRQELVDGVKQVKPRSDSRTRGNELMREWPRVLNEIEALQIARNERDAVQRAVMRACGDEPDQCRIADTAVMEKGRKLAADIHRATLATLSTLNALASGLSRMPGPKALVLVSDGFVVQDMETTLRSVVGQSARAGARVYAIDVRGLNRGGPGNNLQQLQATDEAGAGARFDSGEDGPNSLAVDTGGMIFRNENNIGRALDRIADDSGRYYVLAYQPNNTNFDGKYRTLEVRVKRPGARVRARRGYLALDPSRMLVPQPIKTPSTDSGARGDSPAPPTTAPEMTTAAPAPASLPGELPAGAATPRRARPNAVEDVGTLMRAPSAAASVRLAPPAVTALAREGWAHYAKGDVENARTLLAQAAIEGAPPWVFYALGQSEFALQNFPRAVDAWNTVRQRVPEFKEVYFDLADAHIQMQAYGAAAAVLRIAAGRWPENAEIFNALGVVLARRDALDEAVESFRKAVSLAPSEALGHFNLARALDIRYTKSLRYVAAISRWIGRDSDRTEAIAEYRRYLEIGGPQEASVRESLSRLEWRQ